MYYMYICVYICIYIHIYIYHFMCSLRLCHELLCVYYQARYYELGKYFRPK